MATGRRRREPPPEAPHADGHPPAKRSVRDRVDGLRRQADATNALARDRLDRAQREHRSVRKALDVVALDQERLGGLLAGAMAYRLFLWLVPATLFAVGVVGALTSLDDGVPDQVVEDLGLGGALADAIREGAAQRGWWLAIVVGLFGMLWAGVGAAKALRIGHAAAWGLPPEPARSPVRATLGFAAIVVLLIGATVLTALLREIDAGFGLVATLLVTGVYFGCWLFVSERLPRRPGPRADLVPGALLFAVGVEGIHLFTAWYLLDRAERAASTYGAIGTALVILIWLYVVSRLITGAAVLNAALARAHHAPTRRPWDEEARHEPQERPEPGWDPDA